MRQPSRLSRWAEFKHNNDEPHMKGEDISIVDNVR